DEARNIQIVGWYANYLGRTNETATDLQNWRNFLAQGNGYANAEANFVGSQEAFNLAGGTNDRWVTFLYQKVLNRPPAAGEGQGWVDLLNSGKLVRSQVAVS